MEIDCTVSDAPGLGGCAPGVMAGAGKGVLRIEVGTEDGNLYGILGRDLMRQLASYTISSSGMTFSAGR